MGNKASNDKYKVTQWTQKLGIVINLDSSNFYFEYMKPMIRITVFEFRSKFCGIWYHL